MTVLILLSYGFQRSTMGKPAFDIIEEQVEWAQDRIISVAIEHITDNFDSFPGIGIGLSFMKRSAEKMIVKRLEERIVPEMEEHTELQLAYIRERVEDGEDNVAEKYRDRLLETDPFLLTLDASTRNEEGLRERVAAHHDDIAETTVQWLEEAGDEEYEDYADLAVRLGKSLEEVEEEITELLKYIDWLEEHQENLDLSEYSSVLEHSKVHEWFVNVLIDGLEKGQDTVIKEIREQVKERQGEG